jgi:hypothetical protein
LLHEVVRDVVAQTAKETLEIRRRSVAPTALRMLIVHSCAGCTTNFPTSTSISRRHCGRRSHGDAHFQLGQPYSAASSWHPCRGLADGSFPYTERGESSPAGSSALSVDASLVRRRAIPADQVGETFAAVPARSGPREKIGCQRRDDTSIGPVTGRRAQAISDGADHRENLAGLRSADMLTVTLRLGSPSGCRSGEVEPSGVLRAPLHPNTRAIWFLRIDTAICPWNAWSQSQRLTSITSALAWQPTRAWPVPCLRSGWGRFASACSGARPVVRAVGIANGRARKSRSMRSTHWRAASPSTQEGRIQVTPSPGGYDAANDPRNRFLLGGASATRCC